jgi:hypothetical protein
MGNFGGLTAFYVRLLASRCMPAEPAPIAGVDVPQNGQEGGA